MDPSLTKVSTMVDDADSIWGTEDFAGVVEWSGSSRVSIFDLGPSYLDQGPAGDGLDKSAWRFDIEKKQNPRTMGAMVVCCVGGRVAALVLPALLFPRSPAGVS